MMGIFRGSAFLFFLLVAIQVKCRIAENMTTEEVLHNLFQNYNKNALPPIEKGFSRHVHIRINVQSIFDISEQTSSFTMRYYFQLGWYDLRLTFSPFIENNETVNKIRLPMDILTNKGMKLFSIE